MNYLLLGIIVVLLVVVGFCGWYVYTMIRFLKEIKFEVQSLTADLKKFEEHIESIYSMEMFFGDSTLKGILEHATYISGRASASAEILTEMILDNDDQAQKEK